VDLPTYTNIWRIEKRLYKLYDFRLPAPLPINWIAVFAGITIPYIVLLVAIGLPFNHTLVWLYVLPPGVLTWLITRPVIENKRLPELLESQVRYLTEPRVWTRLTPVSEKDQIIVTAKVWHSRRAPQRRKAAAGTVALRERGTLARRNRGTAVPAPAEELAPVTVAAAAAVAAPPRAKPRTRVRGTGPVAGQRSSGKQPRAGRQAQPPQPTPPQPTPPQPTPPQPTRTPQQQLARRPSAAMPPQPPFESQSPPTPPVSQPVATARPAPAPVGQEATVAKPALEKGKQAPGAKPSRFRLAALRSRPAGPPPALPPGGALKPPAGSRLSRPARPGHVDTQFGDPSGVWPGQAIGTRTSPPTGDPVQARSPLPGNGQTANGHAPARRADAGQPGLAQSGPVWPTQGLSRGVPSLGPVAAPVPSDMPAHATPDVHPSMPAPVAPAAADAPADPAGPVTPSDATDAEVRETAVQGHESAREASAPAEAAAPPAQRVRARSAGAPPVEVAHTGHPRRPMPPAAVPPTSQAQPWPAPLRPVWPAQPPKPASPPAESKPPAPEAPASDSAGSKPPAPEAPAPEPSASDSPTSNPAPSNPAPSNPAPSNPAPSATPAPVIPLVPIAPQATAVTSEATPVSLAAESAARPAESAAPTAEPVAQAAEPASPAAEPAEPEASPVVSAAESATLQALPVAPKTPVDLIAVSGAITPETAIKSPDEPEESAQREASAAGGASEPARVSLPEEEATKPADLSVVSAAIATETGDESQTGTSGEASDSPVTEVAEAVQPPAPAWPEANGQPVVHTVDGTPDRKVPSIERALSGPSKDRNLSWHGKVKIVTGTGAIQGPGARDQEALDRTRARLPLKQPKRVLVLGCTSGAGQTVTTMMTGHILASLREHPVAAVDLHDGTLARYSAPAAWLDEILRGKTPRQHTPVRPDGLNPTPKPSPARLDIIASHDPLRDGDEVKLAEQFGRHYPLTMLDPGAAGLTRLLKVTDQLVVVVPASVEGAGALADTREWLDAHGFAELATHSVTLINGVSRRSLADVEHAESVARGRCRAIVRVPWDDMLPVGVTGPSTLRPQTRVAYTALAGVLVAGMVAAPVRTKP
jgi:hypothetical protein